MVLDEAAAEAAAAAVVATAVIDWFKRSCWQIWLRRGKYDTVKCRQSAKRRKEKLMAQLMQFSDNECHRSVIDDRSGRWVRPSLPFSPSQQQLIYILSYGDRGKSYRFSLFFSTVLFCLFSWLVGWLVGWFVRFLFVVVDVVDVIVDVVALRFCCFVWVLLASSPFWFFRCYLCQRRFFDSKWIRWTDGANTFIWFLFFFFFFFFCGWLQLMASTVESCLVSLCFISNCMISYRNYSRILQVRSVIEKSKADSVMLCFPISVYCVSHDIILYKRLILNVARTACWLTCKQHTKHIKLIYHTAVVACILVVHTEWWILDGRNWIINGRWLAMGAGEDWGWRIEDGGRRMEDGGRRRRRRGRWMTWKGLKYCGAVFAAHFGFAWQRTREKKEAAFLFVSYLVLFCVVVCYFFSLSILLLLLLLLLLRLRHLLLLFRCQFSFVWRPGQSFVSCCCGVNKTVPWHPAVKIRSVDSLRCLCRLEATTESAGVCQSPPHRRRAKVSLGPVIRWGCFENKRNNAVRSPLSDSSVSQI